MAPEIEKTYATRKSTNTIASGELFVGLQKSWSSQWLGQLGLAAAATGNAKLQCVIWGDADPQFNNYSYQYKVRNTRVAVKGKLLLDKGYCHSQTTQKLLSPTRWGLGCKNLSANIGNWGGV